MYNEVQFEDQNVDFHRNARVVQKSTMVKLFEKMGVPEEYVSVVMIGVAVMFFVIAGFILFSNTSGQKTSIPQPVLNAMKNGTPIPRIK